MDNCISCRNNYSFPLFLETDKDSILHKTYTSDSFGGSYMYKWHWVRSSFYTNVYGYFPDRIDVMETTKLNPNIPVIDCVHHYIENKDLLQEYIMLSLYNKVENTKQTNLFMQQLHHLEEHYSKQRNSI